MIKFLVQKMKMTGKEIPVSGWLVKASSLGHKNIVEYCFEEFPIEAHAKMSESWFCSVINGHLDIFLYLLDKTERPVHYGDGSALILASEYGQIDVVKYLIKVAGIDSNIENGQALIRASERGHMDVVKYLISEAGAKADIRNWEALDRTCRAPLNSNSLDIVKYIIEEAGVQLDSRGLSRILTACFGNRRSDIIKYLVEKTPERILNSEIYQNPDFCQKLVNADFDITKYFIYEAPVEKRIPGDIQVGALIEASKLGRLHIVKYLIETVGVPADSLDGAALIEAIDLYGSRLYMVKYLIEDAHVPADIQQGRALIRAAEFGHVNIFEYLITSFHFEQDQIEEAINAANQMGKTAISAWMEINESEIYTFTPK